MWVRGRAGFKDSGLGVKDRRYVLVPVSQCQALMNRYVLWALSRFSQGDVIGDFVEPPKPAKKYRG
jgi:hypothetical protein